MEAATQTMVGKYNGWIYSSGLFQEMYSEKDVRKAVYKWLRFLLSVGIRGLGRPYVEYLCVGIPVLLSMERF